MMSTIIVLLFAICICCMTVMSVKRKDTKCTEDSALLDRDTCNVLKGFAILLVFVHHYGQLSSDLYNEHSFLGYIGVTIFLFITGYVSEKQFLIKGKEYVGISFIKKKVIRLFIPYILITIAYAVIGRHGVSQTVSELIHIENDWFLTAVTIFYLLFMVANLVMPKSNGGYGLCLLSGLIAVYVGVCICLNLNTAVWFNTAFAFLTGCFSAYFEHKGFRVRGNILLITSAILSILFGALSIMRFHYYLTSTLASVCISLVILLLFQKIKVRNKWLALIGSVSWEFYLCQSRNLMIAQNYVGGNAIVWFIAALAASMLVAFGVNGIMNFKKYCKKRR